MPISKNFRSKHYKKWNVYFPQCYSNTFLKLNELTNFFQITASEHANFAGLGFSDLQEYNQSWVMFKMRIEIDKLPTWLNEIEVNTWVEELKSTKSLRNFSVEQDGKKIIGATSQWAVFNTSKRRLDSLKINTDHFEAFPDLHATSKPVGKILFPENYSESYTYKVKFSDIDIVNHVNNTKYLEWCLDLIDPTIILSNKIKAIELNFIKELSLGDEIEINVLKEEKNILFSVVKDNKICFGCVLELH